MALRSDRGIRGVGNRRERQVLRGIWLCVVLRGDGIPFGDEESISRDAQRGVVMKAAPTSPLVVTKAELLLEVLVIALDPLAQLGGVDQGAVADGGRQRGQPVFRRFGFVRWPFDQAPFLGAWCGALIIAMRRAYAHGSKA